MANPFDQQRRRSCSGRALYPTGYNKPLWTTGPGFANLPGPTAQGSESEDLKRHPLRWGKRPLFDESSSAVDARSHLGARRGSKAADYYLETVETFVRDHMAGYRRLFAIENDFVHISVNAPVRFVHTVRDTALGRRVTPNELVFTAVSHVLESVNAEAA